MRFVLRLLISVMLPAFAAAQDPDSVKGFRFVRSIPGQYLSMNVDALGNLYLINTGNRLMKRYPNGDSAAVFNEVRKYGNPTYIDVSNPLKPIVFYQRFSSILILDRFLSLRSTLDLRKNQIFRVQAVANSYDNQIWVFDEQEFKLKKISDDGRLLQESADLRQVLDTVPSPVMIMDSDNLVYVYDPSRGFYIFDYYGGWKNRLPFTGWTDVAVSGKRIYGFRDNKLFSYEISSLQLQEYPLPDSIKGYRAIRAINGYLYLLTEDAVQVYEIR